MSHTDPTKRHEFVLLFDVKCGNPNGDPDGGNLPRVDPQTMHGLVTDVALKRKVRDYIQMVHGTPIFIQSKVALNKIIYDSFVEVGVEPLQVSLSEVELEDQELLATLLGKSDTGFLVGEGTLVFSGETIKTADITKLLCAEIDEGSKELIKKLKELAKRLGEAGKERKGKAITQETRDSARDKLCEKYFDIRMFGAVLATGLNAGQVRGPVQLTFARSIDPVFPMDIPITRQARTTAERMKTGTTEMGRKTLIPYGLYRAHGYFNPYLAPTTGVTTSDLEHLWEALADLFRNFQSASSGERSVQGLYVFTHDDPKGNAPAHKLFELIHPELMDKTKPPRDFSDYRVDTPKKEDLSKYSGVELKILVDPRKMENA